MTPFFFFTAAPSNHEQRICRILPCFTTSTASILVQLLNLLTESLQVSLTHFPVSLSEQQPVIPLKMNLGSSLVVHWLRLHTPNAGSLGLIPGQGSHMQRLKDPACYGKLAHTCVRPEDAWFLGRNAPRQVSLTISSPQWVWHLELREAPGSRIPVAGREKPALF